MVIVSLYVYLQSRLNPSDLLFLFISNNLVVNTLFVLLAAIALKISFMKQRLGWFAFAGFTSLAVILCGIGGIGFMFSDVNNSFTNFLLPLNYIMLLMGGIVMGISALSYKHAAAPQSITSRAKTLGRAPGLIADGLNSAFHTATASHPQNASPARGRRVSHA